MKKKCRGNRRLDDSSTVNHQVRVFLRKKKEKLSETTPFYFLTAVPSPPSPTNIGSEFGTEIKNNLESFHELT